MKYLILILILTATTQSCFTQRKIQPFLGVNFSSSMLDEDRVTLNNISVEPGFQYNHRLFVNLSIGYVENHDIMNTKQSKFRGLSSAACVSVRLLESQYKFSPLINLVLGNIVYSSARGETINREFMSVDGSQGEKRRCFTAHAQLHGLVGQRGVLLGVEVFDRHFSEVDRATAGDQWCAGAGGDTAFDREVGIAGGKP